MYVRFMYVYPLSSNQTSVEIYYNYYLLLLTFLETGVHTYER
jgi:hypothetical protein